MGSLSIWKAFHTGSLPRYERPFIWTIWIIWNTLKTLDKYTPNLVPEICAFWVFVRNEERAYLNPAHRDTCYPQTEQVRQTWDSTSKKTAASAKQLPGQPPLWLESNLYLEYSVTTWVTTDSYINCKHRIGPTTPYGHPLGWRTLFTKTGQDKMTLTCFECRTHDSFQNVRVTQGSDQWDRNLSNSTTKLEKDLIRDAKTVHTSEQWGHRLDWYDS